MRFSDSSGNVATLFALCAPIVAAAAGLAVDASVWARASGNVQGAADQAALAAAIASGNGASDTAVRQEVIAVAAANGFVNGVNGANVRVNHPPLSGAYANKSTAYEVIVEQSQQTFLAGLVFSAPPTVAGRSVTVSGGGGGQGACLLALDPTSKQTISLNGNGAIYAPNCDVVADSANSTSVGLTGNGGITAAAFITSGDYSVSGANAYITAPHILTHRSPTADPLAAVQVPAWSSCDYNAYSLNTTSATMAPGVYCGGVTINSSTVTMQAGVYVFVGGFKVAGNSSIDASAGVGIVMTGVNGNYGSLSLPGGTVLNLTAPSSGPMKGVAMYFDRRAPYDTDSVTGGTGMKISGALYFPSRLLTYAGGGSVTSKCLKAIAYRINITGVSAFDLTNCPYGGSPYAAGIPLE